MVLGVLEDNDLRAERGRRCAPGDRLVLFTDGITEAGSHEGREFGDDRLVELAVAASPSVRARTARFAVPGSQCLHSRRVRG